MAPNLRSPKIRQSARKNRLMAIEKMRALFIGMWKIYIFNYMEKQIIWTVAVISEFAKAKALSVKQAFNYLNLQKHYGAEHMLSFEEAIDDLTAICQRNGGQIR